MRPTWEKVHVKLDVVIKTLIVDVLAGVVTAILWTSTSEFCCSGIGHQNFGEHIQLVESGRTGLKTNAATQ